MKAFRLPASTPEEMPKGVRSTTNITPTLAASALTFFRELATAMLTAPETRNIARPYRKRHDHDPLCLLIQVVGILLQDIFVVGHHAAHYTLSTGPFLACGEWCSGNGRVYPLGP